MAGFSDLLMQALTALEEGRRINPLDREQLRQYAQSIGDNSQITSTWQRTDQHVNSNYLDLPIIVAHFEILEVAKASIKITLPQKYNNLTLYGSGSIDQANGGNIWVQCNNDTGSNYAWQFMKADNTTISGAQDTSDTHAVLGVFGTTGAGAGVNGSFVAEIPNYTSNVWHKNIISRIYTGEFNDLYLAGSNYAITTPVSTIEIYGTDNTLVKGTANLAAGCRFTAVVTL